MNTIFDFGSFGRRLRVLAMVVAAGTFVQCASAEEYKVGFFGPLSGPVAVYGTESLAGTRFALEEIAKNGLLGKDSIKLVVADDMANPGAAAQAVRRMIDADGVVAILGGSTSSGTAAAIEVTRAAEIPQLSPLAVDPSLTKQNNPWFARITQNADAFATSAADWMYNEKHAKSAYLLIRNDNWGQPLATAFTTEARQVGLKIVGRADYEPTTKEFKPMLAEVAKAKPDFLVILGYYTESGLIVKQMAEMNYKTSIFAMTAPGIPQYLDIAGPAAEGTYGLLYYFAGSIQTDAAKKFVAAWQKKFNRLPSQYEGMGYDSAYVMAEAIRRAAASGKVTPKAIRDGIFATQNYAGATGAITILPNGDTKRPLPFVKLEGKQVVLDKLLQ